MSRIKEIASQFGFIAFTIDEYTGFISREPYDIHFSPAKYGKKIGTRVTYKINGEVTEDFIIFSEDDMLEFFYRNSNTLRRGKKVLENSQQNELLELLDE